LSVAGRPPLRLDFSDRLRPGAEACIARLRTEGLRVILLSGDRAAPVAALAAQLGIDDWRSGIDPTGKADAIARLSDAGARVLMVGDGLNDTAALARAYASISPASALDAARVASDMVLTGRTLAPVAEALVIARQATRRIRENFAISIGYNVIAVPIALLGMATPLLAALAMSISSITVTLNALRLNGKAR
ncbi:HAD family hydrolase, partial [Paracoccus liaowanqingii]